MSLVQLGSIVAIVGLAVLPTVITVYIDGLEASESMPDGERDYR